MRTVRTLALVLSVVVLSSTLPALAATRTQDREVGARDRSSITVIVKRIVKRIFGIATMEEIGGPKPAPNNQP
jgi:hypothetical protein